MEMNNSLTTQEVLKWASYFLMKEASQYQLEFNQKDVRRWVELLVQDKMGWSRTDLILNSQEHFDQLTKENLSKDLEQLATGMPIQYVIGKENFWGRDFVVTPATLIPRPETEELVQMALDYLTSLDRGRVLEIGVGSGCIGLTLAIEAPQLKYLATDISGEALQVAQQNLEQFSLRNVQLLNSDVWDSIPAGTKFDCIISNPPYIADNEKKYMDASVLSFEPNQALFAEDDGLAIYKRIASRLEEFLVGSGMAFFEIGFQQGSAVKAIFEAVVFCRTVTVIKDMSGLDRMICISQRSQNVKVL